VDANAEPDPSFACAGDAATLLPNYQGIVFAEAQPGYLAGIVAGSITKSATIGAVGGTNVPAVVNYWRGYENGAKSIKSDVKVLYQETDPDPSKGFNDPTKGRAIAEQFLGQKADVIFQIAGLTGQGVLEAVCDAKAHGIGVDVDQAVSLPNLSACIVTSAEKKLVDTVQAVVASTADGTFKPGTVAYNAASTPAAVGLSAYHDNAALITPDIQAKIDAALAGLKDGSLDPCAPIKCTVDGK
jgi:basic membrane protein A